MKRYELQIGEQRLPQAYGQNHVDGAAAGVGVAQAWGQFGDAVQKFGEVQKRRQDEWDATRAMQANNDLIERMSKYMDDPDTGVTNVKKLGMAQGVTGQFEKEADGIINEIALNLDNDQQRQAFMSMAQRSRQPFWKQASNFEVGQVKEFRDQIFKTTLESGAQMVARDPMDESFFEAAAVQGATAIRAQYVGADPKVIDQAVGEYTSSLEAQRISQVAQDNPLLAEELVKTSPYLAPADAAKLSAGIKPKAELYKTQAAVDALSQQFPPGKEMEGLDYIRGQYSGSEEEHIASAYKSRIGELTIKEANSDAELRKQQYANFENLYKTYWGQDKQPPRETLDTLLQSGGISAAQHRQAVGWVETAVSRASAAKILQKRHGEQWNSFTPQQQEELQMREMGIVQEDRDAALSHIKAAVLEGSATDAEIAAYYQSGYITKPEAENFKKIWKQIPAEQKNFTKSQATALKADISGIKIMQRSADNSVYASMAQNEFAERVAALDPTSSTYRADVMSARRAAMAKVVEESGKSLERKTYFGFGAKEPTPFGQRVAEAQARIESQTSDVQEYQPVFQTDDISLAAGQSLNAHAQANQGKGYALGGKDINSNAVDCSGLVGSAVGAMMKGVNQSTGQEVFSPQAQRLLKGAASADIIENVSKGTGFELHNPSISQLRENMIIGLNAGDGAGGRGYKDIDHVAVVVRDPASGQLKIYESNSKQGVVITDAAAYLDRYKTRGVQIYAVDPMRLAQGGSKPAPAGRRSLDDIFGGGIRAGGT